MVSHLLSGAASGSVSRKRKLTALCARLVRVRVRVGVGFGVRVRVRVNVRVRVRE